MNTLLMCSLLVSFLFFDACKKSTSNSDYTSVADCSVLIDSLNTYNHTIKQIFDTHCAFSSCHNFDSAKKNVVLDSYFLSVASVNKYSKKFLCAIHQDGGAAKMPKNGPKLADSLILKIDCWVKNGMPE